MRLFSSIAVLLSLVAPSGATTLEKLSLEDMIAKSTAIVRGRISGTRSVKRGPVIYTYASVQVLERWKGPEAAQIEVAIPGGTYGSFCQNFSGAPSLEPGEQFVLFLWTGGSGVTQIIGLSQGVFDLKVDAKGQTYVERAASNAVVLDPKTGEEVGDQTMSMGLEELRTRVRAFLGRAKE